MVYRLAKQADARCLADIHHRIKDVNDNGIFVLMGRCFLRQYYRLVLSDPCTVCVCAEDEGRVVGYMFAVLDCHRHRCYMMKNRARLAIAAIGSVLSNPLLLKALFARYRSLKRNDGSFIGQQGARGGYWGWDPCCKDSISSCEMHNNTLRILRLLGIEELEFEVDTANKHVYKFHKLNGAVMKKVITLSDGRERAFMAYDLNKPTKI